MLCERVCFNHFRVLQQKYHILGKGGGLTDNHLFPTVLETEKSRVKAPVDLFSPEDLALGL